MDTDEDKQVQRVISSLKGRQKKACKTYDTFFYSMY